MEVQCMFRARTRQKTLFLTAGQVSKDWADIFNMIASFLEALRCTI